MPMFSKRTISSVSQLLIVPACVVAMWPVAGCNSDAPILARGETYEPQWLLMGSEDLRRSTRVGSPRQEIDEFNLLHVVVPVRNTTDKQLYVQSRFTFYDQYGTPLNHIDRVYTIPARSQVEVVGNSTSALAGGPMPFRLELRYPRVN